MPYKNLNAILLERTWLNIAEMGRVTNIIRTQFAVGDVVHHRLFNYRGVIVDVDPSFRFTDEVYETVAQSRPAKFKPWYYVLVHEAANTTYVAERDLERDESVAPIKHPLLGDFFSRFKSGRYISDDRAH